MTTATAARIGTYSVDYRMDFLPGRVGVTVTLDAGRTDRYHMAKRVGTDGLAEVTVSHAVAAKRSYVVRCDRGGVAMTCDCKDRAYRGGTCKHMRLVTRMNKRGEFGV